jgi:hypothetical protein
MDATATYTSPPRAMPEQSSALLFPNSWAPPPQFIEESVTTQLNEDSIARANWQLKHKQYDRVRGKGTSKPHHIRVKDGGEIDAGCLGKNAWDDSVRGYVPKMIDISIID